MEPHYVRITPETLKLSEIWFSDNQISNFRNHTSLNDQIGSLNIDELDPLPVFWCKLQKRYITTDNQLLYMLKVLEKYNPGEIKVEVMEETKFKFLRAECHVTFLDEKERTYRHCECLPGKEYWCLTKFIFNFFSRYRL